MQFRTYIKNIPECLIDSAKIEGADDNIIFWKIIMPLSKPVLATIALFIALGEWNTWYDTFLYTSKATLRTLQYELIGFLSSQETYIPPGISRTTTVQSLRAVMIVITTIPILIIYLIVQKYLVTGLTIGGVKG